MNDPAPARVLIAGIGNIFMGDDAFGVHVAQRLARQSLPEHVRVLDVGVRSVHLAYELLEQRFDTVVFVDAVARGGSPGTLYVIEPDTPPAENALVDTHSIRPEHVLTNLRSLGGTTGHVYVVGCEPETLEEGAELSPAVLAALPEAERLVLEVAGLYATTAPMP